MLVSRIITFLLLVSGVILLPWWLFSVLAVAALFVFPKYYEFFILAVLVDLLYGLPPSGEHFNLIHNLRFTLLFTFVSAVLFFPIEELKERLKFYD